MSVGSCKTGKREWRVSCEGNRRIVLGVAVSEANALELMWSSTSCWGVELDGRDMDFAKKFAERELGPEHFTVPVEGSLHCTSLCYFLTRQLMFPLFYLQR